MQRTGEGASVSEAPSLLSVVASELLRLGGVMTDYSTLLRDHVTLTCRSINRIFLQAYVPKLQTVGGCVSSCAGSGAL